MDPRIADLIAAGKVLAARAEPYLARSLHALSVREAPGSDAIAADRWWRLHVDGDICGDWTALQWATVLRAEARRLLLEHPQRAERAGDDPRERRRFGLASDATVASDTDRAGDADWPRAVTRVEDVPGGSPGMAVEEVYDLLVAQDIEPADQPHGSGAIGQRQAWEVPEPADDEALSDAEQELLRREIAALICEHPRAASPQLEQWAKALLEPVVDWRRVLDGHVRAATRAAAGRRDYTYTRPSRRQSAGAGGGRALLPGIYAPEPPRVAVIRDTSGSMTAADEDLISDATAEIDGMLHARARVTLIDTDAEAHAARELKRTDRAARVVGGGGTDMSVGLHAAAAVRPRPHLVVVLTDGDTPWPERHPLRGVPVLVALLGRHAARRADDVPAWATTLVVPVGG